MKQRIYPTRYYRLLDISLIILLMLVNCINIKAQKIHTQIETNHKLYIPQGNGPFPVIVAVPGCSGVSLNGPKTDAGRPGDEGDRLFRRHYPRMAERLRNEGFMVLLIDYLTAEGVLNTCNGEIYPKKVGDYIKDAISFVKTIPKGDPSRINVIGWSHGGSGVLMWLADLVEEPIGVESAVAVYPGCNVGTPWNTSLPVLMILGEADDIALPSVCNALIQSLSSQTNVLVRSYPGARHGFDFTEGPSVLSVGNGLTVGRNPTAGDNAWQEILTFLNNN